MYTHPTQFKLTASTQPNATTAHRQKSTPMEIQKMTRNPREIHNLIPPKEGRAQSPTRPFPLKSSMVRNERHVPLHTFHVQGGPENLDGTRRTGRKERTPGPILTARTQHSISPHPRIALHSEDPVRMSSVAQQHPSLAAWASPQKTMP